MKSFDHEKIEKKWREIWAEKRLYKVPDEVEGKENYYQLIEFPYPSGNLHIGHWYAFCVPDIHARFQRMQGKNVLYPIGFDSFGLPAENAAIKRDLDPREWTESNIDYMRGQLESMGASFDWSREIASHRPEYYRWTQWIFTKFFEAGLAYEKEAPVNWCPSCQTVLANEQVVDGLCERCDTEVEQREMKQWFLRITDYAERLLEDLEKLDWPEEIKAAQRNWIGRSEGARFSFELKPSEETGSQRYVLLHGYQASPDTNFHPWLKEELEGRGHEVVVPELPNSQDPTVKEQVEYVLDNVELDDNTTIVGHSLGTVVAMKVAEKQKLNRLVLVAPFIDADFADGDSRSFSEDFNYKFDFQAIRENTREITVLQADDDYAVSPEQIRRVEQALQVKAEVISVTKAHAKGEEEPGVLKSVIPYIEVFTTRPDTFYGVTYLVIAPERVRELVDADQVENWSEIETYIKEARKKSDLERQESKEKSGIELEGVRAIHPATGEELPVWVADYVLDSYGTGAVMAVPAHDERDWEFANRYDLSPKPVVIPETVGSTSVLGSKQEPVSATEDDATEIWKDISEGKRPYTDKGILINSNDFNELSSNEAARKITEALGEKAVTYRLRDWSVGRQRFWGTPLPIVYSPDGEPHAIPEEHLPWRLPQDVDPTPTGEAPLAKSEELKERVEEIFGEGWKPAVDTMDTFLDSTWYYLRYLDPENENELASIDKQKQWMPVDYYSGGAEHTTMHLLYSRFWYKAMHDLEMVTDTEPYKKRMNRGLIMGPDGQKMSKSRGNVIDPDKQVAQVGADTVRMYLAFIGPYNEVGTYPWDTGGIAGVRRFLERVWGMQDRVEERKAASEVLIKLHKTIKKATDDIPKLKFNTAIAAYMEFVNLIQKKEVISATVYKKLLCLLAPFAPFITEEIWHNLDHNTSLHKASWPTYDENLIQEQEVTWVVQINGKVRAQFKNVANLTKEEVLNEAKSLNDVEKWLEDSEVDRVIFVPGKLINMVLK